MNPSVDSWYPGKSKPLSETHPTLFALDGEWYGHPNHKVLARNIQSCTVDRAEHERRERELLETITLGENRVMDLEAEVERLKKELEESRSDAKALLAEAMKVGFVEGERRAIERIRRRCEDCCLPIGGVCEKHTDWELGLGEDKTFNPATDHHNCSAGTCAACGHFDSDISFEEEDSDNNNYTNKGEK